jgi:hypothetical protein
MFHNQQQEELMKQQYLLVSYFLVILLVSCQASPPPQPPTATSVPTNTALPVPTSTDTPEPTSTPEPSPTPIVLPDTLNQTFSGVSVINRESFEYVLPNTKPLGWGTDENFAIWVTKENQLMAKPTDNGNWSGTVFYFSGEKITPNKGVYFAFKYTGAAESFTLGFDNVNPNGERITGDNFHSVAMEIRDRQLLVYGTQKRNQVKGAFKGDLKLEEDTWYEIALAYNKNHDFVIKIWDPNDPQKQLTYLRNWQDFPSSYYFISWISAKRSLLIDNFTVFKFNEIIQE